MKKKHIHSSPSGELPPTVTCLIRYILNILSFCCNHLEVSPNELELNAQRNCKQKSLNINLAEILARWRKKPTFRDVNTRIHASRLRDKVDSE